MSAESLIEERVYLTALFDRYGALLTEAQQACMKLTLYDDYSLSEAAETLGITKQGVQVNLKRAEKSLRFYEEKLGLLKNRPTFTEGD